MSIEPGADSESKSSSVIGILIHSVEILPTPTIIRIAQVSSIRGYDDGLLQVVAESKIELPVGIRPEPVILAIVYLT